jgi:hypothetical protein
VTEVCPITDTLPWKAADWVGEVGRGKKATKNTGEISRSHSSEHEDAGPCSLGQLNSAANSGAKHYNTT